MESELAAVSGEVTTVATGPSATGSGNGSSRMPAAERRRQILDVALEAFGRSGYHDTSMNAVAAEAGVTKPVLYQHFASKHDLFEVLLTETGDALLRAIESAEGEDTPRRQVEAGFRAFFRFFEERPAAFSVLYGSSVATDPKFRRDARQVRDSFTEYLARIMGDMGREDALAMAAGINGLSEGMIRHWMHLGRVRSGDEMAALAARLAWGGLDDLTG
ncbi:MAG: TetR/AcrR family transcriptional regulator [Actinomycetota bacterium]|nr:TetR/AcrR family transcriptional regulator [Actinomycetota bacterium]MEE2958481.1 TetR/AcrR family transcriptional regulator [Actinomycetota bacterium]